MYHTVRGQYGRRWSALVILPRLWQWPILLSVLYHILSYTPYPIDPILYSIDPILYPMSSILSTRFNPILSVMLCFCQIQKSNYQTHPNLCAKQNAKLHRGQGQETRVWPCIKYFIFPIYKDPIYGRFKGAIHCIQYSQSMVLEHQSTQPNEEHDQWHSFNGNGPSCPPISTIQHGIKKQ